MATSEQTAFYNEGVGHGAFIANISAAGNVILEDFMVTDPSKKILQSNQIGAPIKAAGVSDFVTFSAVAQCPLNAGNPVIILKGETFADPYYGFTWWIEEVSPAFRVGEYWKQNIKGQRVYGYSS
jgi:hypothetical protein